MYILKAKKIDDVKEIKNISGTINELYFFVECKIHKDFYVVRNIFENIIENREINSTDLIDSVFFQMFTYCKVYNVEYISNLINIMMFRKSRNLSLLINIYCYLKDIDKETSEKILNYCISF